MDQIVITTSTIRLDQALKLANFVSSGAEAKILVQDGEVMVNGVVCLQRGKKLHPGDVFRLGGEMAVVKEGNGEDV